MTDSKQLLKQIAQNVKDAAMGRVVAAHVVVSNGGFSHGRLEHFRPVNLDEGHKARLFRMDGNDQDVFERMRPEVWYRFSDKPGEATHSGFVPVERGAVIMNGPPDDTAPLWFDEDGAIYVHKIAKPKSPEPPVRAGVGVGARFRNLFAKSLG